MSEVFKIRLAARCEAAGRPENEDNFNVAENLSDSNIGFTTDKVFNLGAKGALLLVCDGMGGMNAGEVASAVGVKTIKDLFAPQLLTSDIFANDDSICMYMKRAIIKADSRIKEEASKDEAKQGMGSTAVMAWLLGQKVYVAWCGDSRCYRYNPATGLEQLSHDHSYVQDLVDTGQLSPDLAFDHPNKNIITRSLGDPRGAAKPDAKVYDLHKGDVILLCSDGLSDSLRDSQIAQSISRSLNSLEACRDALWNDSKAAGWHDNVTVVLAQVLDEKAMQPQPQPVPQPQPQPAPQPQPQPASEPVSTKKSKELNWKLIATIIGVLVVIFIAVVGVKVVGNMTSSDAKQQTQMTIDQAQPKIDNIISPNVKNMDDNMEAKLLDIAKKANSNEVNDYIVNKLQEKRYTIEGAEGMFKPKDYENKLATIDSITNKIKGL